jgi:hypothetical protein
LYAYDCHVPLRAVVNNDVSVNFYFCAPSIGQSPEACYLEAVCLEHPGAADSAQMPNATNTEWNAVLEPRLLVI